MCFTHLCEAVWTDFGQTGAKVKACFDTFLSLSSVTKPYSDHLLLQVEPFGYPGYFLRGWLSFLHKAALQGLLSSEAAVSNEEQKPERKILQHWIYSLLVLQFSFSQSIPDGCSPFPFSFIHSCFITVQSYKEVKEYIVIQAYECFSVITEKCKTKTFKCNTIQTYFTC